MLTGQYEGFVTHSNSVPERRSRTLVDGQLGGVDVIMETTVIMELPKDLRRRIFPRCHVSSLPGIKLPVVACNCVAKLRTPPIVKRMLAGNALRETNFAIE